MEKNEIKMIVSDNTQAPTQAPTQADSKPEASNDIQAPTQADSKPDSKEPAVPILVNGTPCLTVKQASMLSHRTEQAIRMLLVKGNRLGKLAQMKMGYTVLIPVEAFVNFRFTKSGRGKDTYKYDLYGNETMKVVE